MNPQQSYRLANAELFGGLGEIGMSREGGS
jgi:hypothetical protein